MDMKKAAITGAVGGIIASFVFGKKSKRLEHAAKYAALGAGVMAATGVTRLSEDTFAVTNS